MKMEAFWYIAPCRLVGLDRRVRGAYWLNCEDAEIIIIESVRTSETLLYCETTQQYIPKALSSILAAVRT